MCGNDYLDYELQVGPNEWTSWGTGPMMAANEFVNDVFERSDVEKTAQQRVEIGCDNISREVTEDIRRFTLQIRRLGFPLTMDMGY